MNILKSQPGWFCWYLCVYSSTRCSYKDGMIKVGRLLWSSPVQLPAQSKASFEGKSVCTTSQVSNEVFSYNLLYFQSFSVHPCEGKTKRGAQLGATSACPAALGWAGTRRLLPRARFASASCTEGGCAKWGTAPSGEGTLAQRSAVGRGSR